MKFLRVMKKLTIILMLVSAGVCAISVFMLFSFINEKLSPALIWIEKPIIILAGIGFVEYLVCGIILGCYPWPGDDCEIHQKMNGGSNEPYCTHRQINR